MGSSFVRCRRAGPVNLGVKRKEGSVTRFDPYYRPKQRGVVACLGGLLLCGFGLTVAWIGAWPKKSGRGEYTPTADPGEFWLIVSLFLAGGVCLLVFGVYLLVVRKSR